MSYWAAYVRLYNWHSIPEKIKADSQFVRDNIDFVYIDHIDNLLRTISVIKLSIVLDEVPLIYLNDSLFGRR